ncbi:MAG: hypothetical protein K2X94_00220 [Amoebophilaceae bacterium]|nr:hypothetical protein [Amoebophilaceae bacterium]
MSNVILILKNSLKSAKKFRISNPTQLFCSVLSCFFLAMLSMAGECPGSKREGKAALAARKERLEKDGVDAESLVNFFQHLKKISCKAECAHCKKRLLIIKQKL